MDAPTFAKSAETWDEQVEHAIRYKLIDYNGVHYYYDFALEQLKLHTLQKRRYHLDALFLTQVYRGSILCPSALEIVGLRVPVRYIRDFPMFNVCSLTNIAPLLDVLQLQMLFVWM
jgi:hypothetical protein